MYELVVGRVKSLTLDELQRQGLTGDEARVYNDVNAFGERYLTKVFEFWSEKVPSSLKWSEDELHLPVLRRSDGAEIVGEEAISEMVHKYIEAAVPGNEVPFSLSETVYYFTYKYFRILKEVGGIPIAVLQQQKTMEFARERAELDSLVEVLFYSIGALRRIDRKSWLYDYSVNLILDGSKYGIKNVDFKRKVTRMLERRWIILKRRLQGKNEFGD